MHAHKYCVNYQRSLKHALKGLRAGPYTLHKLFRYSRIYKTYMSPTLNGSLAVRHLEHGDAIKIRDRTIFDFYMGLSHVL